MIELWVARDKNGSLFLYGEKPIKHNDFIYDYKSTEIENPPIFLDLNIFTKLKFEDGPIRVKLVKMNIKTK